MADIEWLIEQIDEAPEGPQIGAFFDFDGTLIAGYSALAFFKYRLRRGQISPKEILNTVAESLSIEHRGKDVTELMNVGVQGQAGRSVDEVDAWARTVFAREIADRVEAGVSVSAGLDAIARSRTTVHGFQATLGARLASLEKLGIRNSDVSIEMWSALSETEDVDLAKAILDLKGQEAAYTAALSVTKRILDRSLLDFLR